MGSWSPLSRKDDLPGQRGFLDLSKELCNESLEDDSHWERMQHNVEEEEIPLAFEEPIS